MVGFGSSLRLARRPGWEGAYLDYEALKLLLSQIEAVYEEEGHVNGDHPDHHHPISTRRRSHRRRRSIILEHDGHRDDNNGATKSATTSGHRRHFQDELFMEPNSEVEYLSPDDDDEEDETTASDEKEYFRSGRRRQSSSARKANRFSLSYSQDETPRSEDDDDEDDVPATSSCLPCRSTCDKKTSGMKSSNHNKPSHKHKLNRKGAGVLPSMAADDEDAFYNLTTNTANTFFMGSANDDDDENVNKRKNNNQYDLDLTSPLASKFQTSSMSNDYQWHESRNETSALLPKATGTVSSPTSARRHHHHHQGGLFTFTTSDAQSLTPPTQTRFFGQMSTCIPPSSEVNTTFHRLPGFADYKTASALHTSDFSPRSRNMTSSATASTSPSFLQGIQPQSVPFSNSGGKAHQSMSGGGAKLTEQKRKIDQLNRRRILRAARAKRTRRVPRHLRIAHSKARAITERFLGLLRAETEKVLLFAQSRLGELADTAGSLRFPAFDDEYAFSSRNQTGTEYEYQLSDRGLHPSASSSSDDGGLGGGGQKWTDTSSEEEEASGIVHINSKGSGKHSILSGPTAASAILGSVPKVYSELSNETTTNKSSEPDDAGTASRRDTIARTRDLENIEIVRQQIAHFTLLRKNRQLFQRNEQILGEDMLFLSAVEEADAYTTVGVELMHVLKYICVNLIAVRKICRKHDRLLMNRMLGGYYQRVRTRGDVQTSYSQNIKGVRTLGGLVARVSGDIYEAHPALIGQMNHYKLVGVYDKKIQKLANSRTVQVVSTCLALSLSEYEVARSRADALTKLNSGTSLDSREVDNHASDDESLRDAPSTSSSISLTRLRFAVMSIFAFREASRSKLDYFMTYLARSIVTFTGQQVVGEGLDGCSRETLDFIVSYNPDAALLLDSCVIFESLKQGQWSKLPMAEVMISVLAAAKTPDAVQPEVAIQLLREEERIVSNAVSVIPESKKLFIKGLVNGLIPKPLVRGISPIDGFPVCLLGLNRASCFLFMMNYFIGHSTTAVFVKAIQAASAHSATVIGIVNVSSILITLLHCWMASFSHPSNRCRFSMGMIKGLMIVSSLFGIAGNVIQAVAINKRSVALAIVGRFVLGFSSTEILQREVLAACVPSHLVEETALLFLFRTSGAACGLFIGSFTDAIPIVIQRLGVRTLQASNWLMVALWLLHMFRVSWQLFFQCSEKPVDDVEISSGSIVVKNQASQNVGRVDEESDTSSSDEIGTPSSMLYGKVEEGTSQDNAEASIGLLEKISPDECDESVPVRWEVEAPKRRNWKTFARYHKLLSYHVAIPLTLLIYIFASFAMEVFFTATPIVGHRYFDFGWTGPKAASFLGMLMLLTIPIGLVCEIVSRRYEERVVLKVRSRHL
jgi:hypothetical protein